MRPSEKYLQLPYANGALNFDPMVTALRSNWLQA